MTNLYRQFRKSLHPESRVTSANSLFEFAIDPEATKEERRIVADGIIKGIDINGKELMERALKERLISKKEWKLWKSKGLDTSSLQPILLNLYAVRDGHMDMDKNVTVVTMPGTALDKNKAMLEKRFKVIKIKTADELLKELKEAEIEDGK